MQGPYNEIMVVCIYHGGREDLKIQIKPIIVSIQLALRSKHSL